MAGTIVSDTLQDGSGNSTATTNAIKGSCKAWVRFNASTTPTINASYNVSSITYITSGQYGINFTTAMTDANYCATGMSGWTGTSNQMFINYSANYTSTASQLCVCFVNFNSGGPTPDLCGVMVTR
jgi:hypothetical protein